MLIAEDKDTLVASGAGARREKACGRSTALFVTKLKHAWESVRNVDGATFRNRAFRLARMKSIKKKIWDCRHRRLGTDMLVV